MYLSGKKSLKLQKYFFEKPSYDVTAAILAADSIVHRGCTTGYQSLVTKKPACINLLKDKNLFISDLLCLNVKKY